MGNEGQNQVIYLSSGTHDCFNKNLLFVVYLYPIKQDAIDKRGWIQHQFSAISKNKSVILTIFNINL